MRSSRLPPGSPPRPAGSRCRTGHRAEPDRTYPRPALRRPSTRGEAAHGERRPPAVCRIPGRGGAEEAPPGLRHAPRTAAAGGARDQSRLRSRRSDGVPSVHRGSPGAPLSPAPRARQRQASTSPGPSHPKPHNALKSGERRETRVPFACSVKAFWESFGLIFLQNLAVNFSETRHAARPNVVLCDVSTVCISISSSEPLQAPMAQ